MHAARHRGGIERKQARWGWYFCTPALLFFAVFSFYPILSAFYTSFLQKKLLSLKAPEFVGLANYLYILKSPEFWNSVRATLTFTIGTFVPLLIGSLLLAVLISSLARGKKLFQLLFYSPAVLSSVVAALIWLIMFDPRGLGNQFVNWLLGTPGIDNRWLSDSVMVQFSTILVYFWKYIGYFTIIFITGLASIPSTIFEAARMDGATGLRSFAFITLPLLKPTTVLVSIMSMLQCLKTFSTQYLFTQSGAPVAPVNVITLNIYNTAIRDHRIDRASVMSIILFAMMLVLTWVQFRFSKTDDVSY